MPSLQEELQLSNQRYLALLDAYGKVVNVALDAAIQMIGKFGNGKNTISYDEALEISGFILSGIQDARKIFEDNNDTKL